MKVIHEGWMSDNGIVVQCRSCQAEYVIEDRNDFKVKLLKTHDLKHDKIPEYYSICPFCGYSEYFGIDPNVYPKIVNPRPIFSRRDWKERFAWEG